VVTKSGNMTFVYGAVALLSVLLLIGYLLWEKKKERRFMALFSCVAVVNCGYFRQAVAHTLTGAMMVNRLSYLGAACSMLVLLLIIMDVCRIRRVKWVAGILAGISTLAFLLAASGDWVGLCYKAVSIETVNGMTRLIKDYGFLHILYAGYMLPILYGSDAVFDLQHAPGLRHRPARWHSGQCSDSDPVEHQTGSSR
jgi:uncharacterized membrane protein